VENTEEKKEKEIITVQTDVEMGGDLILHGLD